jgi:flagella basal body P-ring formation protein FlgA
MCTAAIALSPTWACAGPSLSADLPALLRPAVQEAVQQAIPPTLRAQAQLQMDFSSPRGAALHACSKGWHLGRIQVQQLPRVSVPVLCGGERGSVVAQVQLQGPVAHVVRDLPAGHTLQAQDIQVRPAAIRQLAQWLDAQEVPNQVLRAAATEGDALQARDVLRPVAVRRGDPLEIVAQGGGVAVRAAAVATAAARVGDTVTVRNVRTQQLVSGRLVAPGVVHADAQPLPGRNMVKVVTESSD